MPRYFFDVENGDALVRDHIGVDLENRFGAGQAAIGKLRLVGGGNPPEYDSRKTFAIHVRDGEDEPVLKASVSYSFQWLDVEVPLEQGVTSAARSSIVRAAE